MGRRSLTTLRRTAIHAGPTVLGIIVLDFLLLQLMPGDAADVIASESGVATVETMAALRERFGLDQPVLTQLVNFLGHLVQFDLGFSPRYNMSVLDMIMTRLPSTVLLMATGLSLALLLGIIVGSVMAAWVGRWPDRVLSVVVLLFYSMPGFWGGLMAIGLFSVHLRGLPGRRPTRAAMLEVQRQEFMRTAQAKGLHPIVVQLRHALRNALIPVTTVAGMHLGNLLGGAVVVETVFGWPGLGPPAPDAG